MHLFLRAVMAQHPATTTQDQSAHQTRLSPPRYKDAPRPGQKCLGPQKFRQDSPSDIRCLSSKLLCPHHLPRQSPSPTIRYLDQRIHLCRRRLQPPRPDAPTRHPDLQLQALLRSRHKKHSGPKTMNLTAHRTAQSHELGQRHECVARFHKSHFLQHQQIHPEFHSRTKKKQLNILRPWVSHDTEKRKSRCQPPDGTGSNGATLSSATPSWGVTPSGDLATFLSLTLDTKQPCQTIFMRKLSLIYLPNSLLRVVAALTASEIICEKCLPSSSAIPAAVVPFGEVTFFLN